MIDKVNLMLTEGLLYYVGQFTILIEKKLIYIKLLYYTGYFTKLVLYRIDILMCLYEYFNFIVNITSMENISLYKNLKVESRKNFESIKKMIV